MKNWTRFCEQIGSATQVFVVGPMLKGPYKPAGPTVYVDGGTAFRVLGSDAGSFPEVTVGDGDSSVKGLDVVLPQDKDFSDLAFVFHALPPTIRHIELLGFLGGRRDHELINFGETHKYLLGKTEFTTVRFDESIIAFHGGSLQLNIDGVFSVVVLEKSQVRIQGACKYALPNPTVLEPAASLGLSNVGHGNVIFESAKPCFLFLR